ncbi:MAG: hypothetical protein AB7V56_00330 [Candidatus Nitrosocosmicus sp.]
MARKTGDSTFTALEKQLLLSMVKEYSIFGASDYEIRNIIQRRTGRNISQKTLRSLRIQAAKENDVKLGWLDRFCKGGIIDYYINRTKELELVQHHLMENFVHEAMKPLKSGNGKIVRNKHLMDKLAKTIGEINHRLCEVGLSPPVIAKMLSLMPKEILEGDLEYLESRFKNMTEDQKVLWFDGPSNSMDNDKEEIKLDPSKASTAILPPIDGVVNNNNSKGSNTEEATATGDQPIF